MYFERFREKADGTVIRQAEVQTELAEWYQVEPGWWERRVREW